MFRPEHANANTFRWSGDILAACGRFRQGDIIRDVSLAYSTRSNMPVMSLAEPEDGRELVGIRTDLELAMITSQTCDIAGKRGAKYPLALIAPVYNIANVVDRGHAGNIRADRVGEFIALDGPEFTREGELWVADLRLETAIEKSILFGRDPVRSFMEEDAYLRCARKIARVRGRAAIDDKIRKHILQPLQRKIENGSIPHEHTLDVLVKATPTTVAAAAARLFVIVSDNVEELQGMFDDWHAEVNPTLPIGFTFLGIDVRLAARFTWLDARGAELVDFTHLSPGEG